MPACPIGTYEILHEEAHTGARVGRLWTKHGPVETPVFMPVGTQATVKTLAADDLETLGASIILGNTYHLMLRPGMEIMEQLGGLHAFQDWKGPLLTDSGGFQVFSLSSLRKITEDGVAFQSHIDGKRLFMGPKESMAVQRVLGSDIAMLFDECIPYPSEESYVARSVEQTLRWAKICLQQPRAEGQLYFGIVQGSEFGHLRKHCALELAAMRNDGLDGFAVGGVSVGEPEPFIMKGISDSVPFMPLDRPRYVMGLGDLWQMTQAVGMGCDMFDCVIPTRNARNGSAFTNDGPYPVKAGAWKASPLPVEPGCTCPCCSRYSRGYVRHLLNTSELLAYRLLTLHNIHCYLRFMERMRDAIKSDCFTEFKAEAFARLRESPKRGHY
ncbi:MAG: tRNA guanosine(34) transglycosylase Tgt [Kiritimatiellia bacterium]